MEEYVREPCPWRIVDDCGGAFSMGTLGGGIFQAVKGFRNAPLGLAHRLRGSANAVRIRAPQIGGEAVIQPPCSGAGPKVVACYLVICRELCHLGRTLLHYRLWFSSPEEERGPVELHNKWCSDWGHSGCTQWTGFHGGLCHDGGDSAGSDRGFRNPPHQIYGAAVSEPATLFRRARSFTSRRWGSSAGGKGAVSVEEAGPESRCFYGDARWDGWF